VLGQRHMKLPFKEFLYVFLMGTAIVLAFMKTLVFGSYLTPEMMGYYSIAITIAGYGTFLQLGLLSGLNRELPVRLGRREDEYYSDLAGETTVAVFSLQVLGITIYYIVLATITFKESSVKEAFYLAGLLTFSASFGQIVLLRLRAEQRILGFSILKVITSSGILLFGIMGIHYLGYKGAIFAVFLVEISSFLVVSKGFLKPANYFVFRLNDICYLLRIGFPLMLAGVLINLQMSMDRLFLIKNMSAAEIGIYQIGTLPLTFGVVAGSIVSQYVSPKLLYRYGQVKSLKYVFDRSFKVSLMLIGIMLCLLPIVPALSGFVIDHWLPDYKASMSLILIFYIGSIFTAANIVGIVINAANKQVLALYQAGIMTGLSFVGYLMVSHFFLAIEWYAYVNITTQIISFLVNTSICFYLVKIMDEHEKISRPNGAVI